jgi:PKD repeat protein
MDSRLTALRARFAHGFRLRKTPRDARMRRNSVAAVSATVALALSGIPGTAALWTGSVSTNGLSLTAGSVSSAITGLANLTTTYSSGFLTKTTELVLTNNGASDAEFTTAVTLSPTSSAPLAAATTITLWAGANCSNIAVPPPVAAAAPGTWSAFPQLSGTIRAGASRSYCLRTRMDASMLATSASIEPTLTLTLTIPNTMWKSTATVSTNQSVVADTTVGNDYTDAVRADGATRYWRMGEPSSSSLLHDWIGNDDAYGDTGVTRGTAGALIGDPNTATTYPNDSTGAAGTRTPIVAPNSFALEAWFRTTTTSGGKIVGFGNQNSGPSNLYDRHIFMDGTGHIAFGVLPATQKTLTSTETYNDGAWHHVVGNLSSAGQELWVDGVLLKSDPTTTYGYTYPSNGYWRIGGDPAWAGDAYFDGAIDEVAVYGSPLSANQVNNHRNLGRQVPPGAADPYGLAVYTDAPTIYWRLAESSGTIAADSGAAGNTGTYSGSVSGPVRGAVLRTRNTAATFDGTYGAVTSTTLFNNPRVYSLELWFNTTTVTGGKLIGFGDGGKANGDSYSHDRHIYLQDDGKIRYGIYPGSARTIVSSAAYNDGQWHHVVATQSSAGMKLYVDGDLASSNATHTEPEVYDGYWKVGSGDIRTGWTGLPTTPQVTAKIDEVAVYGAALTETQIKRHYSVATGAPAASFTSSATGLTATLNAAASSDYDGSIAAYSWDFGDGTPVGSGVSTMHTYPSAVPRTVTLTVTDNAGRISTTSAVVTPEDTTAPTTPGTPTITGNTGTTVSLTWPASTDDVGVTSYEIYRGATLAGTSATPNFTDTGRTVNTTYTYTVKAKDAANNTSMESPSVTVTTLATNFTAGAFYSLANVYHGLCITAGDSSTDTLQQYECATATNQNFQFTEITTGYFLVNSRAVPTKAWDVDGSSQLDAARVKMATQHGALNQQWQPVRHSENGSYSFVSRSSGKCLQVVPGSVAQGADLQQATCAVTNYQRFMLTAAP